MIHKTQKKRRILFWVGISLPLVALVAMTWLVHQSGKEFNTSFNWVLHNYKVLGMFEQVQAHIVDAEANQRGFLLTGREEYIEPYQSAMTLVHDDLTQLKNATRGDVAQQAHVAMLEQMVASELVFDPVKALASGQFQTNTSVVTLTARGKHKIENMRKILMEARGEQEQALSSHQQDAEKDVLSGQVMSLVLIAGVALALVFVTMIMLRLEKLQQFVTVCAWTGQVRHNGEWVRLDEFLRQQFGLSVSHSLSKEASEKMMREIEELNRSRPDKRPPG